MATMIPVRIDIEGIGSGITVKPGETLVLSFRKQLNEQEAYEITSRLKETLPGVRVVVVDDDVRLTVIPGSDDLRDMVSEMMIDGFRKIAEEHRRRP